MDIKEIYELKHALDLNISNLVNEFTISTDMTVTRIDVDYIYTLASKRPINTLINVEIVYEE